MKIKFPLAFIWVSLLLTSSYIQAQNIPVVKLPRASQRAIVGQTIGITDITIKYHRPSIRGRKINQQNIAPLGRVWRAGANENTVIEFTDPVQIEGKALAAGKYGLHMIPGKEKWIIIFSKNYRSWGSYYYKKEEDALRVEVKPSQVNNQEWLTYEFANITKNSALVSMKWATTKIDFKVTVDVPEVVVKNLREEMRDLSGYYWQGPYLAARYCYYNNYNLKEAMQWINRSIGIDKNFQNLLIKSQLMSKQGKKAEGEKLKKQAYEMASENQLVQYGYNMGPEISKAERDAHFEYIVKRFKTWTAYQAQGIVYRYFGNKAKAIKSFEKALKLAPEKQQARLENAIKGLKRSNK